MNRFLLSAGCALAVLAASAVAFAQEVPNVAGTWSVEQTGANGTTMSTIRLRQSGNGITGSSTTGTGFNGEFATNGRIDGKWHGPGGAGWLTIYVSPNGHSFNGTWGYNGRKANGSFVGNEILPPSPITAAGVWTLRGAGDTTAFAGQMKCTESGVGRRLPFRRGRPQRQIRDQRQSARNLDGTQRFRLVLVLVQRRQQQLQRCLGQR